MHCIICIWFYEFYSMNFTLCILFYAFYSMYCFLCTVFYSLYSSYCVWYSLCVVLCALFKAFTLMLKRVATDHQANIFTYRKQIQRIPRHTSDWLIEILTMKISTCWDWLTYLFIRIILDITWCTFYKHLKECNKLCILLHLWSQSWNGLKHFATDDKSGTLTQ